MTSFRSVAMASIVALSVTPALAHETNAMNSSNMSSMSAMMGMHDMMATVSSVDSGTGLVDVDAGGMKLRVHFPPNALAGVKVGDKITLHMAFSKP